LFFFFADKLDNDKLIIDNKDDLSHIKVLRLKDGERLKIVYQGHVYLCDVCLMSKKRCEFKIIDDLEKIEKKHHFNLFQGYPKKKKFEFIIEKTIELGIDMIVPFNSENCVSKYDNKKQERFYKIAKEACMQSHNPVIPKISHICDLKDIRSCSGAKYVLWHKAEKNIKEVLMEPSDIETVDFICGPEGGLTDEEISDVEKKGFIPVRLPTNVLRTETAALVFLSILRYEMH